MNKQALIAKIATDTGITKAAAAGALESLLKGIQQSLKKGDPVTFVGFGTFKTAQRKARVARNPQDRRRHQDPEAPGRAVHRRQGPEGRGQQVADAVDRSVLRPSARVTSVPGAGPALSGRPGRRVPPETSPPSGRHVGTPPVPARRPVREGSGSSLTRLETGCYTVCFCKSRFFRI